MKVLLLVFFLAATLLAIGCRLRLYMTSAMYRRLMLIRIVGAVVCASFAVIALIAWSMIHRAR